MKDNRYIDECQYERKLIEMNQFSFCVLSQEEIDLQEYHVGAKDIVTL